MAVRIDGPRVWDRHVVVCWNFTDLDEVHVAELRNGTLIHRKVDEVLPGATTVTLTKGDLLAVMAGAVRVDDSLASGRVLIAGDPADVLSLLDAVGPVDPAFPIVTPRTPLP